MASTATMQSLAASASETWTEVHSISFLSGLKEFVMNMTSSILPSNSSHNTTFPPFRLIQGIDNPLDRNLFRSIPRFVLRAFGLSQAGQAVTQIIENGAGAGAAEQAGQVVAETTNGGWLDLLAEAMQASTFKSYWGMIQYLCSRWAFTCFALALILNRISVYGASRQRIHLTWNKRLGLRLIPILLLITQIYRLSLAIRCQSSPDYALFRHGDLNKYSILDWSTEGGFLHNFTSAVLFPFTDEGACEAVGMKRPSLDTRARHGSFRLLWPTFLRLSLSHLVENLSCALQQIPVMTEVGMSIFEHSLAFAEAEVMISQTLGLGFFGTIKSSPSSTKTTNTTTIATDRATIPASSTILAITDAINGVSGPHVFDKVNVPQEVLLVAVLSCCNALSSNIISILGKQRQWRLINTGFWGLMFMSAFIWGFLNMSPMVRTNEDGSTNDSRLVSRLMHFPTVAIIGFLPHMMILLGILVCSLIYLIALTLTAVSLGTNPHIRHPTTLKERFSIAHDNLQAAVQVRGISLRWHEDFYTALLRIGFAALTAASEAVFLNEGRSVEMRQFTWLEEDRLDEVAASRATLGAINGTAHFQIVEEYGIPSATPGGTDRGGAWESGYAKERKIEQSKSGPKSEDGAFAYPNPRTGGIGALQRTTRFYLLFIYMRGIMFLVAGWIAFGMGLMLDKIGITARPRWLRWIVGRSLKRIANDKEKMNDGKRKGMEFWIMKDGKALKPQSDDFDIEPEMRRRVMSEMKDDSFEERQQAMDEKMYDWWKKGGWFGNKDDSGEYRPLNDDDFDTTSVVSISTTEDLESVDSPGWEDASDGQRTPTQEHPTQTWSFTQVTSREASEEPPDTTLDVTTLARLLNPQDRASREEARILAAHLSTTTGASPDASSIMTRSRFRKQADLERSRVLLAGRTPSKASPPTVDLYNPNPSGPQPLSRDEEAEVLEELIVHRRKPGRSQHHPSNLNPDQTENEDEHALRGPLCVVCQSASRTIIAWPCRCLCVCEDCRVSLALNNFGNCVTCRRTVGGFVRLWVP